MFKPLGDSHYVISNGFSDSFILCFMCIPWEGFLSSTHTVIMNLVITLWMTKLIFSLIEFPLRLFILFSNIISFILLSLCEYVNTIRIRIIIVFLLWLLYRSDEYYAHHHHDPPKDCNSHCNDNLDYN